MKQSRAIFLATSLAMGLGLVAGPSSAQMVGSFPAQSVRIISLFPAGSGPDVVVRIVGEKLATSPSLFKKLPYDTKADFTSVGGLYRTSFFVVVGANSPIKTVKGLGAAAAIPGKMTYGSNSVGGPIHLGAAQLEAASDTKMVHVPYKEMLQVYAAVSTGEIDWAMGSIATAGTLLKAGKLRFIAVADTSRAAAMPNVPTVEESGGSKGDQLLRVCA